jgi:thiamine-phosphate pyrophosphorylase
MADVRLYLFTPPLDAVALDAFAPRLAAALARGDVASVLVRAKPGAEGDLKRIAARLIEIAAAGDAALLIAGDPRLAARVAADGVHVEGAEAVAEAVASLKGERIVGAGALRLRDDAMTAAEGGADYVMFGEPGPHGNAPPLAQALERVGWWAEIFETPCVAYAARLEDVAALAAAGADFIALDGAVWDAADPAAAVENAMRQAGRAVA